MCCLVHANWTLFSVCSAGGVKDFYAMSYLYFGALATTVVVLVGVVVSCITGGGISITDNTVYCSLDIKLFSSCIVCLSIGFIID